MDFISTHWQVAAQGMLTLFILWFINNGLQFIPGLTQHFFTWVQAKVGIVKNEHLKGVLQHVVAFAGQKVLMLENTEIAYLKQQAAAGNISKDQLPKLLQGVKDTAVDATVTDAKATGLWPLAIQFFGGSESSALKWLGDVVESHVSQIPSSGIQGLMANAPATGGTVLPLPERSKGNIVVKADLTAPPPAAPAPATPPAAT
jgi:hypothetical protein